MIFVIVTTGSLRFRFLFWPVIALQSLVRLLAVSKPFCFHFCHKITYGGILEFGLKSEKVSSHAALTMLLNCFMSALLKLILMILMVERWCSFISLAILRLVNTVCPRCLTSAWTCRISCACMVCSIM